MIQPELKILHGEKLWHLGANLYTKRDTDPSQIALLHPDILFLIGTLHDYHLEIQKPMVLTNILSNYGTHLTGRAVDMRTRHLTRAEVGYPEHRINALFPYGKGYDGQEHDTVVFHRQAKCLTCAEIHEVDPFTGIPENFNCIRCKSKVFRDYGQHFHIQVKKRNAWHLWNRQQIPGLREQTD